MNTRYSTAALDCFDLTAFRTSVDTVKTRLQGQPAANPPKYHNMFHAYSTILREEGVTRGLYGGVAPAMSGSRMFKRLVNCFAQPIPIRFKMWIADLSNIVHSPTDDALLWSI